MGVAVCGMHYTGMMGEMFTPAMLSLSQMTNGIGGQCLGFAVFVFATLFLAVILAMTMIRNANRQAVDIHCVLRFSNAL